MASTAGKIQIWNMALGFCGTRTVASETEQTPEAIQCGIYWDNARRTALRDYPWHFAQSRAQLAMKDLPELYEGVWRYAYALPDKCLKAHAVYRPMGRKKHEFEIVRANDGTDLLLTDVEFAILAYTQDVEDVARYDEDFVLVMARKLACLIGIPLLKNNSQKLQELVGMYNSSLPAAHDADSSERKDRRDHDSWLVVREGWQ